MDASMPYIQRPHLWPPQGPFTAASEPVLRLPQSPFYGFFRGLFYSHLGACLQPPRSCLRPPPSPYLWPPQGPVFQPPRSPYLQPPQGPVFRPPRVCLRPPRSPYLWHPQGLPQGLFRSPHGPSGLFYGSLGIFSHMHFYCVFNIIWNTIHHVPLCHYIP